MSIYKQDVQDLLTATKQYKDKKISLDEYKSAVWQAACSIVHVEEKQFRSFLQNSEGDLDIIQFTVDSNKIFDETLKVVEQIEIRSLKELSSI